MRRGVTAGTATHVGWGLRSLTDDDIVTIHENTLNVMERTGIEVDLEAALKIFKQGGCHVNTKTRVVKFPPYVVRDALSQCPPKVLFAARNPEHDFITGGRNGAFLRSSGSRGRFVGRCQNIRCPVRLRKNHDRFIASVGRCQHNIRYGDA